MKMISTLARKVCVAPMLGYTDRHFRYLVRMITKTALLYTEMIPTAAIIRNHQTCLLHYHQIEHPIGIQLSGNDPSILAFCARTAADHGYDEVNLNVCCPSKRVTKGGFGACLMETPDLVARCVEAVTKVVNVPVTIKHHIGVGSMQYRDLVRFVSTVAQAGCAAFIVHARKIRLNDFTPKQNRSIPPLEYATIYQLKADFSDLTVVLNGDVTSLAEAVVHLEHVDGVMIGRSSYRRPYFLVDVDQYLGTSEETVLSRCAIVMEMVNYLSREVFDRATRLLILRHMCGLFYGTLVSRSWRRLLYTIASDQQLIHDLKGISRTIQMFLETLDRNVCH